MANLLFVYVVWLSVIPLSSADLGVVFVRPTGSGEEWQDHYCINYNPHFQKLPYHREQAATHSLVDLSTDWGCLDSHGYNKVDADNHVVAVARGNCTFSEKALMAQQHKSAALLIVTKSVLVPIANITEYGMINITVAGIQTKDFTQIQNIGPSVDLLMYSPGLRDEFDPCMVVLFVLAVGCVTIGGYWSGLRRHERSEKSQKSKKRKRKSKKAKNDNDDDSEDEDESVDLTFPSIIVFVLMSSTFLVLLFFFYDYLVYVVIVMFCMAGTAGLFGCIQPLWDFIPCNTRLPANKVPCFSDRPQIKNIVLVLLCAGVAIFWGIQRHESYAWVIQDFLGVTFCINILRIIQMPNLKICGILLLALFVYDVFFVFITPLITTSGKSIMVDVATGGSSTTGEQLPMVFAVPRLTPSPLNVCDLPMSLLGFGDIIIPGLLVGFNHGIDLKVQSRKVYFTASVIGYGVGLLFTFAALYFMETGQPALLYLVPCTLLTTMVIGCCRGEFKLLWNGDKKCPKKDDDLRDDTTEHVIPATVPQSNTDDNDSIRISISSSSSTDELLK
ncbi:signal peptide peptidase-like 2B [Mizuhopecten yessoensis]|uniref:Signal peptide peptidase-like 2B n=1 Tax=Mizuhopecten yessoensis TaxID=6573 RepID=A0A210PFN5_MIZYE|nr:signal peptide peptidase-like 2B [Mizuhopecten yessoensis]OWF35271.1 Signal peptide peptidase-like 2B [Mizuhopecten yessoensis]